MRCALSAVGSGTAGHSCNERHCPLCGQSEADDWLALQESRLLLPTPYFLVTFTLPEPL